MFQEVVAAKTVVESVELEGSVPSKISLCTGGDRGVIPSSMNKGVEAVVVG